MTEHGMWGPDPESPTKISGRCLVTALFLKEAARRQLDGASRGDLGAIQALPRICGSPGGHPACWYRGLRSPRSLPEQLVWLSSCCHHPARCGLPGRRFSSCPNLAASQGGGGPGLWLWGEMAPVLPLQARSVGSHRVRSSLVIVHLGGQPTAVTRDPCPL